MIKIIEGDIFKGGHQALVNPINLLGEMGALAGQFEKRFPAEVANCKKYIEENGLSFGEVVVTETEYNKPAFIFHLPTTNAPGARSALGVVVMGLQTLVEDCIAFQIKNIGIPALGCGVGGLNFDDVVSSIAAHMAQVPGLDTFIYKPHEQRQLGRQDEEVRDSSS